MTAIVPRVGNMESLAALLPSFGVPEGCVVRGTFIERPDASDEHVIQTARSCPDEALASSGYCETGKALSESEGSTQFPATEESSEIDDCLHQVAINTEYSASAATSAWLWWSDEPDETLSHPSWFAPQAPHDPNCATEETWQQWNQVPKSSTMHHDQVGRSATTPASLVLRGLPFNTDESEIKSFLKNAGVGQNDVLRDGVVLLTNPQGRPSGFAEIHLTPTADFWVVHERLHMQLLGGRYIEVLPPRQARKRTGGGASKRGQKSSWRRS